MAAKVHLLEARNRTIAQNGKSFTVRLMKGLSNNPSYYLHYLAERGEIRATGELEYNPTGQDLKIYEEILIDFSGNRKKAARTLLVGNSCGDLTASSGWERIFPEFFNLPEFKIKGTQFVGERYE